MKKLVSTYVISHANQFVVSVRFGSQQGYLGIWLYQIIGYLVFEVAYPVCVTWLPCQLAYGISQHCSWSPDSVTYWAGLSNQSDRPHAQYHMAYHVNLFTQSAWLQCHMAYLVNRFSQSALLPMSCGLSCQLVFSVSIVTNSYDLSCQSVQSVSLVAMSNSLSCPSALIPLHWLIRIQDISPCEHFPLRLNYSADISPSVILHSYFHQWFGNYYNLIT